MLTRVMKTTLVGAAVAMTLQVGAATAQEKWTIQTSMSAGESFYKDINTHWLPRLEAMTSGRLKLELTPVGSVVPYNETIDAVEIGVLQGDITATVYFGGRDKAFSVLGDLIAGYDRPDQIAMFCYHGGGREALQELYNKFTDGMVHIIGCGSIAREAFVSTVPIHSVDDLKGKKIRSPEGLAAAVFKSAGAAPVGLPSSETYSGVDKGVVDAADFSSYTMNDSLGFHKIAAYPIYPGIHSMPVLQFSVNKARYDALDDDVKVMLDVWYGAMIV